MNISYVSSYSVKSSLVNNILFFNSDFKVKNEVVKVEQKLPHFYFTVLFKSFSVLK